MGKYITLTVLSFLIFFAFGQQDIDGAHQHDEDDLRNATIKFKTLLERGFQETDSLTLRPHARERTEWDDPRDYPRNIGNDIFQNVAIEDMSPISVEQFEPNLREASIKVVASWDIIDITGTYTNAGKSGDFRLTLENIKAEGIVGIALGALGSFEAPSVENLKVTLSYAHYELKDAVTNNVIGFDNVDISNIINEYFNFDVSQVLRQALRSHINAALLKVSINDVFEQDLSRAKLYSTAMQQRATNADALAGFLLNLLRMYFLDNGLTNVKVPDIYSTFEKKWGFITFKSSFLAEYGYAADPTSIQRTGPFSIDGDFGNDNFALYGSVGFQTLKAKFQHYRVKVGFFSIAGELLAKVYRNSVYFMLSGRVINDNVIKVSGYEFEIRELSDIKVEATGLSFALNWLLNIIATRVVNNMRDDIRVQLQNSIRDIIDSRLEAMNYEIPLGI